MIFYGILLALLSTIFGQFLRFEIGSGGILFLDVFLPFLSILWGGQKILENGFMNMWKKLQKFPLFWESFFLITLFSASLFLSGSDLTLREFSESGFYLFRYFFLLLFAFIVFDELSHGKNHKKKQKIFLYTIFTSGVLLAILGFIQLKIYPDFKEMAKIGWDPHIGRLLSTWFDPNFLGGLFSFLLVLLAGIFSVFLPHIQKDIKNRAYAILPYTNYILFSVISGILLLALLFTFSRSALLTFVLPVFFLGIFYFRKILLIAGLGILFVLPFSDRAMQRIGDGIQSAVSVTESHPLFLPDPTARLRVENFEEGIHLVSKNPENFIRGIGFNTIRLHRTENIHSSGGFDSSLLNVFVTTGIFGLIVFLWFHLSLIIKISRKLRKFVYQKITQKNSENLCKKGIQRGLIFSLVGIFAQSFFINFLFFPLFLIYFFGILGYAFSEDS